MNAGISEEVGQTTRGFIDAMKSQPALLAMVFVNCAMLALLFYMERSNNAAWREINEYRVTVGKELLEYVKETSRLLAQCSVIPADQIPKAPELK